MAKTIRVKKGSKKVVKGPEQEKVWQNFQLPKYLRDAVAQKAFRTHTNLSAFYRKCAEIYLAAGSNRAALNDVEALVNELTFSRPTAERPEEA